MRHQARLRPDGFDCACGYGPKYRRDTQPAQIRADFENHLNKKRPTHEQVTDLMTEVQAWESDNRAATAVQPDELSLAIRVPDVPQHLVDGVAEVVNGFEWVRFPALEWFVRDPGGPQIMDLVSELAKARTLA